MSETEAAITLTNHAMLVAWGQYGHCLGLIGDLEAIPMNQKTVVHSPQRKVIEFLVANLGGLTYLKDISHSAHPLDQDQAVAMAWGQTGWADYSGVSRTLHDLTEAEVEQIIGVLQKVSQPMIDREVLLASSAGRLELDGDLSPRPVSDMSTTYPGAEYGHMNDRISLGFQAALVSMKSPQYGRLGLSVALHPGSTVSSTQAANLVEAAEKRIGRYPLRRTGLLQTRLAATQKQQDHYQQKASLAQQALDRANAGLIVVQQELAEAQSQFDQLHADYTVRQRIERPNSHLAKAREKLAVYQCRLMRRQAAVVKAEAHLKRQAEHQRACQITLTTLEQRLERFQADNAHNSAPIQAVFRLDAGFGTAENVALLIEMGYEVYSKPFGSWLSRWLREHRNQRNDWVRVGSNAEMMAWKAVSLEDFPYPLDIAQERFWTVPGEVRLSGLLHFGSEDVTTNLPAWFHYYNGRQTIEAANKESKLVFEVHHLKVRQSFALALQEQFALFSANFIRFASVWLTEQCPQIPDGWKESSHPCVKQQVKIGAHTSAWISWKGQDCLLRFEDCSVFAGRSFHIKRQWAFQPVLPFAKSYFFSTI
jgi:hypothetical protein